MTWGSLSAEVSDQGSANCLPVASVSLVWGMGMVSGEASMARLAASAVSKMARMWRSRRVLELVVSYCF